MILNDIIASLERTPDVLEAISQNIREDWIQKNEGDETWSPYDIIGHLIHGENTDWIARAKHIMEYQDKVAFSPFDRYAQFELSKGMGYHELLATFRKLREENIKKLKALNLSEDDLSKKGLHPALGPVNMSQLLHTWAAHDLSHISQISRVLASHFKDEVGPWKQYLRILNQ